MTDTDQAIGQTKACTKCGEIKPHTEFYLDSRWGNPRSRCKKCTNQDCVQYVQANPEKTSEAAKRRRKSGNTKDKERSRRHYVRNREKELGRAKRYREEYKDVYLAAARASAKKKRETVMGKLTDSISRAIKRGLQKGAKAGRRAFEILPYSPEDLKTHLERQFLPGMTWENYGLYGWHIDHIVPLSSFSYKTTDDREFQACWALSNLRPMWRQDNLIKSNKVVTFI